MNGDITRHPLNAPGRYYVDWNTCLDHQCCDAAAPNNFKMDEYYTAYVFKQPDTDEEEGQCRQALEEMPNGSHPRRWQTLTPLARFRTGAV